MPWFTGRAHAARAVARRADVLMIAAMALAAGGCAGNMKVNTDYDRSANFAPLKTYSWKEGTPLPNPLMSQRVVAAVDKEMAAKGFSKVESGGDVTVTYHASADKELDVQSFNTGGPYACYGGCSTSTTVTHVTVGTIIVDLIDGKTDKLLWRGTASDTVSDNPSRNEQKINDGVHMMFANYPPKG
jgi:hypothetical protein